MAWWLLSKFTVDDDLVTPVPRITDFAGVNVEAFIDNRKTVFKGIGPDVLRKLHERAKLVTSPNPQPYLTAPLALPRSDIEIFFDVETDPMRNFCYLHGMLERRGRNNSTERFDAFFADDLSPRAEHGRCRRLAKDWENLNHNALAFVRLASIRLMLRKLCIPS